LEVGFVPSFGSGEPEIVARKFGPLAGMGDVAFRNFQRIKHLISDKERPKLIWTNSLLEEMMKLFKAITIAAIIVGSSLSHACDVEFNITLQTFGEGVLVELRSGEPGRSRVVKSARSSGGLVQFAPLCPGSYFLAIGDDESVSVTPGRIFENGVVYSSRITLQRGAGNVSRKSRKSL